MCAKEGEGGNERNDITLTRGACTGIMWAALCRALLANRQHSLGTMRQSWRWGEEWQGKVRGGGRVMFISERPLYLFDVKKLKKVKKAYEKPDKYAISSKSKSQVYSVGISGTISTKSEN